MKCSDVKELVWCGAGYDSRIDRFLNKFHPQACGGLVNRMLWFHLRSTTEICEEWRISKRAFRRLAKTAKIEPIYFVINGGPYRYSHQQLALIPPLEIEKAQARCLRGRALFTRKTMREAHQPISFRKAKEVIESHDWMA